MTETTFRSLGISQATLETLEKKGYINPTPIQEKVIPVVLQSGKDVVAQAATGTGKTGAFGIPLVESLNFDRPEIQALVLAPTRELALQVASEITLYKGKKKINIITLCGGQPMGKQIQDLKRNSAPCIVVGTPGRIVDHINKKRLHLEKIGYLVLDEVDEMLDIGFKEDLDFILSHTNNEKRCLVFSATFPPYIMNMAKKYLNDYEMLKAEASDNEAKGIIEQSYFDVDSKSKFNLLCRIVDFYDDFYGMIFCNTRIETERLSEKMNAHGYSAERLHGDLSQSQRESALNRFKTRQCRLLLVTDVAARGIDVKNLTHVINYSVPQTPESYTHRIGRTGRAGASGYAMTFVEGSDFRKFRFVCQKTGFNIPKGPIPEVEDIVENKKRSLLIKVDEVSPSKKTRAFAQMLLMQHSDEDLVAKLLELTFSDAFNQKKYGDVKPSPRRPHAGGNRSKRNYSRDRRSRGGNQGSYNKRYRKS